MSDAAHARSIGATLDAAGGPFELPVPPVPTDADLRRFHYMPLDVSRLLNSDFVALADGPAFKAAVLLWARSWHQVPAGSLPDNQKILAHLSGAGADWPALADIALHGWTRHTDGRLYHRTISALVLDALNRQRDQRRRTEAATRARLSKRATPTAEPADVDLEEDVPAEITCNVASDVATKATSDAANDVTSDVTSNVTSDVAKGATFTKGKERKGSIPPTPQRGDDMSRDLLGEHPPRANRARRRRPDIDDGTAWEVVRVWNRECSDLLPEAKSIGDPSRRRWIGELIQRLGGIDGVTSYFAAVRASDWYCGKTNNGWKADLDWCLNPKNVTKLVERFDLPTAAE